MMTFLIVYGGIAIFVWIIVILDLIGRRGDERCRRSHVAKAGHHKQA